MMEYLQQLIDYALHLDTYLFAFVNLYGGWAYPLLFLIIFCETGLIITPFLPGDSLLFAAGSLAAQPELPINFYGLLPLLILAAFLGNQVNYWVGRSAGIQLIARKNYFFKQEYVTQANHFYENYGGKTIIFARFFPIIRTFVPFVAGLGRMNASRFFAYNLISAGLWISSLLTLGYTVGSLPIIKNNFNVVIYGILIVTIIPSLFSFCYSKYRVRQSS